MDTNTLLGITGIMIAILAVIIIHSATSSSNSKK